MRSNLTASSAMALISISSVSMVSGSRICLILWSWRRDLNPRPSDYKSESAIFKPFGITTNSYIYRLYIDVSKLDVSNICNRITKTDFGTEIAITVYPNVYPMLFF